MNPFFSVIIPTYNRALLIKKAIQSVLRQTYTDWELIIVDDGSTDTTIDVVKSYLDKRIRYIYQQNAERSEARNNGIKNALGKYICFLDSDDYFLASRLELLFQAIEKQNFPIAAFYTGAGIEVNEVVTFNKEKTISTDIFTHILNSAIHSQQMCIHSNILQQFKYDKRFRIGEDMELWLRIADKFPFIFLPNQQTIIVVDQEDRSVNVKRNNVYAEYLQTLQYIFSNVHTGNKISKQIQKRFFGNCYYGMAKYNVHQRHRIEATFLMSKSIFSDLNTPLLKFRVNVLLKLFLLVSISKIESLME